MKTYEERTQSVLEKAKKQKHNKFVKITSVISCSLALLLGLNLFLFVPYQTGGFDTTAYRDSKYYSIIQKLSGVTYGEPVTANNFTRFIGNWGFGVKGGSEPPINDGIASEPSSGPDSVDNNGSYEEVTNNQVKGVTEGDLFKRSNEYIFYLNVATPESYIEWDKIEIGTCTYTLDIYSIAGTQSQKVAEYPVEAEKDIAYGSFPEMFLSKDCNTVTLLVPCTKKSAYQNYTAIISLDVSDVYNTKEINRTYVSGSYLSSRMTDECFLLISNFSVKRKPDFSVEEQFIPQTGADIGNLESLPIENIIVPDSLTTATYTLVCSFDENMQITGTEAFLSYSRDVYVSQQNVFVMRQYTTQIDTKNQYRLKYSYPETEINCVGYGAEGLKTKGAFSVKGTILNRYCMDEYEGVLRVFTNLQNLSSEYNFNGNDPYPAIRNNTCNLYCVDLKDFKTIASEEDFAPANERIRSARFDGNTGYVCTSTVIINSDPVFAFNLSDYDNITYTDTGTIAGFSSSLTKFSGDTLLGIGEGEWQGSLKIELYRETGAEVISVAAFEIDIADFSPKYKAYFIDAEHGLIGLGISYYDPDLDARKWKNSYIVLYFDGYELTKVYELEKEGSYNSDRATFIENYLYILGEDYFKVIEIA